LNEALRQVERGVRPGEACKRLRVDEQELFRLRREKAGTPPPALDGAEPSRRTLAVAHEVAVALGDAADVASAARLVLRSILDAMGWDFGAVWTVETSGERLECAATCRADSLTGTALELRSYEIRLGPGEGLPGRVWASAEARWYAVLPPAQEFPRAEHAAADGLGSAYVFPALAGREVVGVVELFRRGTTRREEDVAAFFDVVGAQLGHFLRRRRSEEALRRRESDLARLFEDAPVGIRWIDEEGRILRVNRCEAEMLGFEAAELAGRPIADLHVDRTLAGELVTRLVRGETVRDVEARLRCRDGTTHCVRVSATPAFEAGRFVNACFFTQDVTQHRIAQESLVASEARTRTILENALDAYVAVDAEGKILGWNPRAAELFGRARAEVLGRRWDDTILPAAERRRYADAWTHFLESGDERLFGQLVETTARRADGSEIPVEMTVTPVKVGDEWTFHAFVRDITDRRSTELALRASERASRRRAEALRRLATAPTRGADAYVTLVAALADTIGARHVSLGELRADGTRLRSLAVWSDGKAGAPFDVPIAGTPAEKVAQEGTCFVRERVAERFAGDARLAGIGAQAYLGSPLRDGEGRVVGVLFAVHDDPLDETLDLVSLFELFATRAATELCRTRDSAATRTADRLRSIVGRSGDRSLSTIGLDGRITSWNTVAAGGYGYDPAEMTGRHLSSLFTPEDVAHDVPGRLLRLAATEGLARHDGWCVRKDATRVWTELTLVALRRDSGEVYGFVLS
jgi:PAS domain S-box-containing protein